MAQVFTNEGLERIIQSGLYFGAPQVTVEALQGATVEKSTTTTFKQPVSSNIELNQVTLTNFTAGTVIDKIQLKIGGSVIWYEDNLNYNFVTSGDLTIDFSISLSGSNFFVDGLNAILTAGLNGKFIGIYLYDTTGGSEFPTYSSTEGQLEPGSESNKIKLNSPVIFNMNAQDSVKHVKYTIVTTKSPLIEDDIIFSIRNDNFTNDGTLTFSNLEFTLNN